MRELANKGTEARILAPSLCGLKWWSVFLQSNVDC